MDNIIFSHITNWFNYENNIMERKRLSLNYRSESK